MATPAPSDSAGAGDGVAGERIGRSFLGMWAGVHGGNKVVNGCARGGWKYRRRRGSLGGVEGCRPLGACPPPSSLECHLVCRRSGCHRGRPRSASPTAASTRTSAGGRGVTPRPPTEPRTTRTRCRRPRTAVARESPPAAGIGSTARVANPRTCAEPTRCTAAAVRLGSSPPTTGCRRPPIGTGRLDQAAAANPSPRSTVESRRPRSFAMPNCRPDCRTWSPNPSRPANLVAEPDRRT